MALIKWDDEEDKKKDELYGTPVKAVTSVQSGAWQPAPSGADAPAMGDGTELAQNGAVDQQPASQGNYLLSEEKAQVDEAKRQRDAQIAEARRQAAAQQAAQAMQVTEQTQEQPQPKTQKYTPVKGEGGAKGFLKSVGAGIQQSLATVADVGIQAAAIPGGLVKDGKDLVNYMAMRMNSGSSAMVSMSIIVIRWDGLAQRDTPNCSPAYSCVSPAWCGTLPGKYSVAAKPSSSRP